MMRDNCKECNITLSEYEMEEYEDICLDCYRDLHDSQKREKEMVIIRLKSKKQITFSK